MPRLRVAPGWRARSASVVAAVALSAGIVLAQQPPASTQPPAANDKTPEASTPDQKKKSEKATLLDATRVSTDAAARRTAEEKSKTGSEAKKGDTKDSDAVVELQPATDSDHPKPDATDPSARAKKSSLPPVHGEVYGAAGGGTQRTGTSVGVGTKSGKTHVTIEAGSAKQDNPH